MRVAALTMAYNEPVWARVWARYYSQQVGANHCYLIDHGSDDGSTEGLPVRVERVPRAALDEGRRAAHISARAAELLRDYDAVVHSDVDEIVLADPDRFDGLAGFAEAASAPVITTVGLGVQHLVGVEPALDLARPVLEQRRALRFSGAICKPAFVRRPVRWVPGFHRADAPMVVGGLALLHLRYADLDFGLQRLRRTRMQAFVSPETNPHQRVPDAAFADMLGKIAQLPQRAVGLKEWEQPLAGWLRRVRAAQETDGAWLGVAGDELWLLPDAWRGVV